MHRKNGHRILVFFILLSLTALAIYLGMRLHRNSVTDRDLKADYFTVNQIKYGLLSGENWTYQVNRIIADKIDSFQFDDQNKALLESQLNTMLGRLLDEVDKTLNAKKKGLKDKIRYSLINTFFDVNDFRKEIPSYSRSIIEQLENSKYRKELKTMVKEKVTGFLGATRQDSVGERGRILAKYDRYTLQEFNAFISQSTAKIKQEQKALGYGVLAILLAVLVLWIFIIRQKRFFALTFLFSVLISFIALFIGISLPMIEIDARISELDLHLLSSHIVFHEQVIFYQAKSILDVVHILITNGRPDTVFVGFLILLFSVLFPVTKLICTTIYLYIKERSNLFIRFMAFNSGKWSMADVMVIAIFMAYVGFQSILDNQLEDITVQSDTINVLTTNRTNLQTGFLVFVGFCLFNLVLAEILKRITRLRPLPPGPQPL